MTTNSEIYLIGTTVLVFLIIVFFYIKKISNSNNLKMKIEDVSSQDIPLIDERNKNRAELGDSLNEEETYSRKDELAILYLISIDKSKFDINQLFGFIKNFGGEMKNKYFCVPADKHLDQFRVINALNPGTFDENTETFAIVVVSNLSLAKDPVNAVKQIIEFSINFSEKFHANICDEERAPITKQMIAHIESRAQEIARINKVKSSSNEGNQ
ncbi:MAG: cell division protein ZipA [Gammaproteobacteria bacterium]|nr:cell division protein ZipA [Gammaproteobacteria bacterium]